MDEFKNRLVAKAQKYKGDIALITNDFVGANVPAYFERFGRRFDVLPFQMGVSGRECGAYFGFKTKLARDLSGCEEIWGCIHFEGYRGSPHPEELRILMSEFFQAGAQDCSSSLPRTGTMV